jgi:uncharacterized protein involved in exopolysaccharide biosynthesis
VQDKRAQYLVSSDLQDAAGGKQLAVRPVTQEDLNSEVELLTSAYLIKAAIAGLPTPAEEESLNTTLLNAASTTLDLPTIGYGALHSTPAISAEDRWAQRLERHLHPSVIKLSDVIEVDFSARDPRWAQTFLERLVDQYLAYHAGLSSDPQAQKFFNSQAQLLETRLNTSEDQVRQFKVQSGLTDLQAQRQAAVMRLSDLKSQRNHISASLAGSREQFVSLGSQMQAVPERVNKEVRSVQNASLTQLKPQVMQLKAQRAELLSRYQPNSQRIKEIDAKLDAAQRILNAEDELQVQEKSSDINPVWLSLATSEEQAKTRIAASTATLQELDDEIKQTENDLQQITTNGVALTRLERQVGNDREAYISYVRKSEEARTAQALNLSKILNVSIAQPPSLPLEPVAPRVAFNLLVGLVLAAGLGFGAAYWEEQHDERIFDTPSIYEASGLKTVAVFNEEV